MLCKLVGSQRTIKNINCADRLYHDDRTHLGLAKDTPAGRTTALRPAKGCKIQSLSSLCGQNSELIPDQVVVVRVSLKRRSTRKNCKRPELAVDDRAV